MELPSSLIVPGTRVIQECLNKLGHKLTLDGIFGSKSKSALYNCDDYDLLGIEFELLMENGMSIDDALVGAGFKTPGYRYLSIVNTNKFVDQICDITKIPELTNTIQQLVGLEANAVTVRNTPCYDVLSTNGSSRGITQFQPAAWADAASYLKSIDKSLDPGVFKDRVYFPINNILACVGYALINGRYMKKKGVPVNAETLYLSHNQGLGFWDGSRINVDGQSVTVQRLIQKYS